METLIQLDPAKVLAEDNTRFGLKPARIESLAASILESGGVLSPVEVEPLIKPQNGYTHRLTAGFYRHAAVTKLNAEQNAGLTLPAIARTVNDPVERLRHQLAENMERENQSPMDQAIAIKKLLDAGVSRGDVRRIFARPGGKKGNQILPASNAWVNISLALLELPKPIQEKIHNGTIGFKAAYELGKVPADKRAAVVERAEAERDRQLEIEEKDEQKYLAAEAKVTEAQAEEQSARDAMKAAQADVEAARAVTAEKQAALKAVQKEPYLEADEEGKKAIKERLKAAEVDVKAAQKVEKDAINALAKLHERANKAADTAKSNRERLEMARKAKAKGKPAAGKGKGKALGQDDIKKAAEKEGVKTGAVALNATEIKQVIKDVTRAKDFPKVQAIAEAFGNCFAGITTTKQLIIELSQLTREAKPTTPPPPAKK